MLILFIIPQMIFQPALRDNFAKSIAYRRQNGCCNNIAMTLLPISRLATLIVFLN